MSSSDCSGGEVCAAGECVPGGGDLCTDSCVDPGDGYCDDGGPGSDSSLCEYGTDCLDCGPRPPM